MRGLFHSIRCAWKRESTWLVPAHCQWICGCFVFTYTLLYEEQPQSWRSELSMASCHKVVCSFLSAPSLHLRTQHLFSYFCLVSVVLASWDYRRQGQQESTQRGTCARQLFIWMNLICSFVSCVLTLALQRGGHFHYWSSVDWYPVIWKVPGTSQAFINTR